MRNSRSLSELLARGGNKLSLLKARSKERSAVLIHVRAALPERLAQYVTSAGVDQGRLTVGVVGAVWASRLRYSTDVIRARVAKGLGVEITAVRVRVVG
jgi:Dna[CI] antecedent, DciA